MEAKTSITSVLLKTPFKHSVGNLQDSIKRICPYSDDYIYDFADKLLLQSTAISAATVSLFILFNLLNHTMNLYAYAVCAFLVYVVFHEWIGLQLYNLQKKINKEFGLFLNTVKNAYSTTHSVISSIRSSAEMFSIEIQRYAYLIEKILTEKDAAKMVHEYTSDYRNSSYIRLFVSTCYQCITIGDTYDVSGASIFCKNMQIIKEELEGYILKEDRTRFKFMGFALITVVPSVFLNYFGILGLRFAPQTASFYDSYGFLIQLTTVILSWYIYSIILDIKTRKNKDHSKNTALFENIRLWINYEPRTKTSLSLREKLAMTGYDISPAAFISKMMIYGIFTLVFGIVLTISMHSSARAKILNSETTDINLIGIQREQAIKCIIKYSNMYKNNFDSIDKGELETAIGQAVTQTNSFLRNQIMEEIEERIDRYQKVGILTWKQYLVCVFAAMLVGFSPYISLRIQYFIFMSKQGTEVRLFQITVLLMKDMPTLTALAVLEAMESQAFIYKPLLLKVTNEYSHDSERALRFLRASCSQKTEVDAIFSEIVNAICNMSRVGNEAFANIENDIEFAKRLEALSEDIGESNSAVVLESLSYIPAVIVVGLYFIVPFIWASWSEIQGTMDIISTM